jgi:Kdo2-lipid IVA lauroyltransferase/acyltransferase
VRLLLGLMWLLHWLPLPLLGRIGEAAGSLLFKLLHARRMITLTNLRLCLPELSEIERHAIARNHFRAYARSILERGVLWWAPQARIRKLIVIEPNLPLEAMQSAPVILLCPHFVCLDVAGVAVMLQSSLCSIYTTQQSKVFDDALRKGRTRFQPMTAPARIAAATGARVVPVVATFLPNYRGWKVTFHPPWENYPGDDIVAATRAMNAFIERHVREAPAEYFWSHKRFKTRPPGVASVYDRHDGPDTIPLQQV